MEKFKEEIYKQKLEAEMGELRKHNDELLATINKEEKTTKHFKSPLDGGTYRNPIIPGDVRYVFYIKPSYLKDMVKIPILENCDIANALFLGVDRAGKLALLANGSDLHYYLGHRVWTATLAGHLEKKLMRVPVAGNRSGAMNLPSTKEEMDDEELDWTKIFNNCWSRAKFLPLSRDLTKEEFLEYVIIWRFRDYRKISGRLV